MAPNQPLHGFINHSIHSTFLVRRRMKLITEFFKPRPEVCVPECGFPAGAGSERIEPPGVFSDGFDNGAGAFSLLNKKHLTVSAALAGLLAYDVRTRSGEQPSSSTGQKAFPGGWFRSPWSILQRPCPKCLLDSPSAGCLRRARSRPPNRSGRVWRPPRRPSPSTRASCVRQYTLKR